MLVRLVFALSSPDMPINTKHPRIIKAHFGKFDDYRLEIVAESEHQNTVVTVVQMQDRKAKLMGATPE